MGEYTLEMPVYIDGENQQAKVDFMFFFDLNSQLSIEVDKVIVNGADAYDNMPPRDISNIANYISETFYDWYEGVS